MARGNSNWAASSPPRSQSPVRPRPAKSSPPNAASRVPPPPPPRPSKPGRRLSEPPNWTPFNDGGPFGIVPRRGLDPLALFSSEQLRDLAITNPMRLVTMLPDIHPSVDMALNTYLRLTCGEDACQVVAEDPDALAGEDGTVEPNQQDTVSLNAMWASLPSEAGGGFRGLRTMLAIQAALTGMLVVEAVPGPVLTGVSRVHPVDSLTTDFTRDNRDADLTLRQRQRWPVASGVSDARRGWLYDWVPLPPDRVFWRAMDQTVDGPHGRAPYASAVNEVIADLALMQDLRDAVHNAAWPRIEVGVNLAELHKVAVEVYRISDATRAAQWVTARFQEVVDYVANLNADDNLVHDSSGNVKTMEPGSFTGLEGVLSFLRQRIAQSLKTLPTLLGINDGSTFNYTSVEWAIYAQSLESMMCVVDEVLTDVANFHLRLIGSKSQAKAIRKGIRTNDLQVAANTKSTEITNATNMEKLGYLTHDQASMSVTGRKAVAPAQPGVVEPLPPEPVMAPGGAPPAGVKGTRKDKPGPKDSVGRKPGDTQEERNAKKNRPGSATLGVLERLGSALAAFKEAIWATEEEMDDAA